MFDYIRTHQRLMQFLLLLIIFPSFALFGIEGYINRQAKNVVAEVAGKPITQEEVEAGQREQMERFRQMFGQQFDAKMFDTPEAKQGVLEGLIAQRAIEAEAAKNHLSVSDQALQQAIQSMPGLAGADGKFDLEGYKAALAARGMTPVQFQESVRHDMVLQQLNTAVQASAFSPATVANALSDLNDQEREVQELVFKTSDFASQVKVTDEMLKAYYDKNGAMFDVPEQVKAEYVVLNSDIAAAQVTVSDADIKSYYDQNASRYGEPEQRRARHILITVAKDASAEQKAAAKQKAEQLVAQLRKNPDDFAKLAKENSQDPASANLGGDLDYSAKGGLVAKPLDDAVFNLKQGEISNVIESDFGYHVAQVTDVRAGKQKSLDEVKGEIAAEIKKQLAAKKFTEMAEQFSDTVYEQADSLKPVAEKLNLKIETASGLSRTPNPATAPNAPVNNAKFLSALFSDDAIKSKRNTEAVEVAPNTLVSGRVLEYKPVTRKPLEEVQAVVRERVVQEEAAKLAKQAGEARLAELKAGKDVSGFSASKSVSRVKAPTIDPAALPEVMKADAAKLPAYVGVDLRGGYGVYRISKVSQPAKPDTARRQNEQQQIAGALAQQEMLAYIETLKKKAKVEIIKPYVGKKDAEPEQK